MLMNVDEECEVLDAPIPELSKLSRCKNSSGGGASSQPRAACLSLHLKAGLAEIWLCRAWVWAVDTVQQ